MQPFIKETGIVAPLDRVNVDTDQIIPKQFLKRIERTGFGQFLFYDWRFDEQGNPRPDFFLNQEPYNRARILLTRNNFGSGSSREHAPWALTDFGFRAILAPSFADIFYNNCFQNGLLPVKLPEETIDQLFRREAEMKPYSLTVDLESCRIYDDHGLDLVFDIEPFRRETMLKGLDDIGRTLEYISQIEAYEQRRFGIGA